MVLSCFYNILYFLLINSLIIFYLSLIFLVYLMESENKIIALNDLGLKLLENNTAHSVFYFNQALLQARCLGKSQNKSKLLAMTYNNLGCYYNAINQPPKALEYFLMSAGLGRLKGSDDKSTAYSHLNIAGILSKQNQHEKALRHALKSIHHLKKLSDNNSNSTITLITAYQVVSMEYLSLDQKTDAKVCYETALSLSTKTLGKTHQKTQELSKFYTETFKPQNKYMKIRTGSVGVKRDLTPSNIQKRLLKTRLLSQMSNIRNTAAVTPVFAKPTNFRSFHVPRIKIDFGYLRNLENYAAIRIQSW